MVQVTDSLAAVSPDVVSLYYTTDPELSDLPLFVFHGPSTTANSTLNSSRIQIHVLSAAGHHSYPRLTISPNSPLYNVVNHLPRDEQGDEVSRGLAFGLLKYFRELPETVKSALIFQSAHSRGRRPGSAPTLFGEQHAANLASAMVRVDDIDQFMQDIDAALDPQTISHIDVDLVLPPGSITPPEEEQEQAQEEAIADDDNFDPVLNQYGIYAPLVKLFGEVAFLPTSKLRRAPSKASSLNRTRSFLKSQKMSLRREMGELVDTEGRYVLKLHELVNHMADDFRTKAKNRAFGSFSPSEQDLQKLFPSSLDKILQINSAFLNAIRKVMDDTEEEAMQDLESDQVSYRASRYGENGRLKDPTGAIAFAKVLLEWFPKFSDCYQEYIRASQDFPKLISGFLKQQSSFSQRVQSTGEQKLRSAVIEPVQRLPRYSLFIDNIVNYLPISHPALSSMLKARDIITTICSLDPPATDKSQIVSRLKTLVDHWPPRLFPQGRLISAVDVLKLSAPYHLSANAGNSSEGILLLFADTIVVLSKKGDSSLSARGVMAEVDKPSAATMMASATAAAGGQKHIFELSVVGWHALNETRFTESSQGRIVWMTFLHESKDEDITRGGNSDPATVQAFLLQGPYEGKAAKWTEEVTKARVEGRFSESERESDRWCLHNVNLKDNNLNIYTAVFEEGIDRLIEGRKEPAPIRIVVDHHKGTKGAPVGHYGVEIVANVSTSDIPQGVYSLEIGGLLDKLFVDSVDATTFMPIFAKRVGDLLRAQYYPGNPTLTAAFISRYSTIINFLHAELVGEKAKPRRPSSPVKMLSSFLSGGSINTSSNSSKQPRTPLMGSIPIMPPATTPRSNSLKGSDYTHDSRSGARSGMDDNRPSNPLVRLEETYIGYVAAIHSRKGNILGKTLRARGNADELDVNALYNTFIENPFDTRTSSEMPVDVLFCAFEKFLQVAWRDQMGPVITLSTLQALQEKNAQLFPGDFAEVIKVQFADMAPQNRRAFVGIIKLLTDLLEACGNDGDRGALTAAFAELLVPEGGSHDVINLLDRMVNDCDRLFDDIGPGTSSGYSTPMYGSMSSHSIRSANTGSLTSNTSSIRKRFGFDSLLRQNSKTDSDTRPSVWRTLSKTTRSVATGESTSSNLSKDSLHRSRSMSVDTDRIDPPRRPLSRERPTLLGAFEFDERPSSSHMKSSRLSTIGASPPPEAPGTSKSQKKKRRSSLSDLKTLLAATTLDTPSSPLSGNRTLPNPDDIKSPPRTPSPTKSVMNRSIRYPGDTPKQKESIMSRTIKYRGDSPSQKENSPATPRTIGSLLERPRNIMSDDTVTVRDSWSGNKVRGHKASASVSNIPVLRGPLHERKHSQTPPTRVAVSTPRTSPQKLRLQSPQKLRERLQNEAKAITAAEASLQSELSRIGQEMAKFNSDAGFSRNTTADIQALSSNIKALESRIPVVINDLNSRNDTIQKDLEKSLLASEAKVKGLDQLYRETSAETEILYEKFNGELGKIIKALKGKGKDDKEDLITKLKEAAEETAKMKKENAKLKRETVTLRALLKAHESA